MQPSTTGLHRSKEFEERRGRRDRPVTVGELTVALVDVRVSLGRGIVKMTPALVPTQSRSRQASSAVTRRQAILCCRIMSSATENNRDLLHSSSHKIKNVLNLLIQNNNWQQKRDVDSRCLFIVKKARIQLNMDKSVAFQEKVTGGGLTARRPLDWWTWRLKASFSCATDTVSSPLQQCARASSASHNVPMLSQKFYPNKTDYQITQSGDILTARQS